VTYVNVVPLSSTVPYPVVKSFSPATRSVPSDHSSVRTT
jgi:hypothetical protein